MRLMRAFMPGPIHLRTDYTPADLQRLANVLEDKAQARRVRAIAAVLEGRSRTEAAHIGGMERQTLRDWVHRFNAEGPDGLKSLRSPGRPPKLDGAQRDELAALIAASANDARPGLPPQWKLADLVQLIRKTYGVELDEVSVGRIMKRMGYVYTGLVWQPPAAAKLPAGGTDEAAGTPDTYDAASASHALW